MKRVYKKVRYLIRVVAAKAFIHKHKEQIKSFRIHPLNDAEILVVQGMFRSGTSLTCDVIKSLGVDFGPEKYLIQPVGKAKKLNPKGFFENYFFTSLSYYIHFLTGSKGDDPAEEIEIEKVNFRNFNWEDFVFHNLVTINDRRVEWRYKVEMFKELFDNGWEAFISNNFTSPFGVKVPMLALYSVLMKELFPNAVFLVVFRNPKAVLKSVESISSSSSYELYYRYNHSLLNLEKKLPKDKIFYLSYDMLIKETSLTVNNLTAFIESEFKVVPDLERAKGKIDVNLIRNSPQDSVEEMPNNISTLYDSLKKKAL